MIYHVYLPVDRVWQEEYNSYDAMINQTLHDWLLENLGPWVDRRKIEAGKPFPPFDEFGVLKHPERWDFTCEFNFKPAMFKFIFREASDAILFKLTWGGK